MKKMFFLIMFGVLSLALRGQIEQPNAKESDSLKNKLETLFMQDQLFRRLYQDAEKKLGQDSVEMDYFWNVVEEQDKRIANELIQILENYGWLGISDVGRLANTAIWSIIQHSSLKTKEKYAPLMKRSVLKNESQPIQYARLIDRILVNNSKPQIYGSQTTIDEDGNPFFFEIEKPAYVNHRRKEIGLEKIENFAKEKGIEWNVVQQVK